MARLHVEGWAPEYGAAVEPDERLAAAEGSVDPEVEDRPWEPVDVAAISDLAVILDRTHGAVYAHRPGVDRLERIISEPTAADR